MAATEAPASALDTSGAVLCPSGSSVMPWTPFHWTDLDAFTQGYLEALFVRREALLKPGRAGIFAGFSDLTPEALAQIIADCAAYGGYQAREAGAHFWDQRQAGECESYPPLAPYLGDDGLIRLSPALTQHGSGNA